MKTIRLIATTIIAVGGAAGVLITLWAWTNSQKDISWMTFFVTLFITLIAFLVLYFIFIEPAEKKNKIFAEKMDQKNKTIEEKMDSNFNWIKNTLKDVLYAIEEIQKDDSRNFQHTLSPKSIDGWAVSGRPLKLSESGKKLLEKSAMDRLVSENMEKLILKIEELKLETAYDVQDKSFSVLAEFVLETPELEKKIKDFVFNNPVVEGRNIGFRDVIYVGSLVVRDKYLEKHLELNTLQTS